MGHICAELVVIPRSGGRAGKGRALRGVWNRCGMSDDYGSGISSQGLDGHVKLEKVEIYVWSGVREAL